MAESLVLANNVSRRFGTGAAATEALRRATCAIFPGDRIALTGPSGSGKSTLLHLLGGLDTPTTGTVSWPGLGSRNTLRPGRVADIFQGPSLLPPLAVLDNVRFPLLLLGIAEDEASAAAMASLDLFGLASLRDKLPEEISGGQAQRVAIARALAMRPMLVLADEPTGQLDTATAFAVLDRVLTFLGDIGAAIVLSTHDERIAERLETHWTMHDGILRTNNALGSAVASTGRAQAYANAG